MARIYVIEDDEAIRDELTRLLAREGHEVTCCDDFPRAAQHALDAAPDLVLLDLSLPGTDGQLVCRELRRGSQVPIVVLTARATEVDEVVSMEFGADDFVPKPYSPRVLMAHVGAALRRAGAAGATSARLELGGVALDLERSQVSHDGRATDLSRNETLVLATLMRRAGGIVSREELMRALWESDAFVDDNTLTVNVSRVRAALARIGVTDYLATHRGQGYAVRS